MDAIHLVEQCGNGYVWQDSIHDVFDEAFTFPRGPSPIGNEWVRFVNHVSFGLQSSSSLGKL